MVVVSSQSQFPPPPPLSLTMLCYWVPKKQVPLLLLLLGFQLFMAADQRKKKKKKRTHLFIFPSFALEIMVVELLLSLPSLTSQPTDSLLSPKGVNFEVAALVAVKKELVDGLHVLGGWDINSVDPCTWSLIACDSVGFVVALEMPSQGLSGYLSRSIGNLSHLQTVLLQNNDISGLIPPEIGTLSKLQTLDLSGNQFVGEIPSSLGSLSYLNYLRLNGNGLSGRIPAAIANLTGLAFLDLSYNNLSGPVPKIRAKDYSIAGNKFLCASYLRGCNNTNNRETNTTAVVECPRDHQAIVAIAASVSCLVTLVILTIVCLRRCIGFRFLPQNEQKICEMDMGHLKRFTYRELQTATDNFNAQKILGQGGFGVVYKGLLRNGTLVAVKRLKDPNVTGEVQFQTEVEMIGLALHRNLLRLHGFCMTPNERLLIYPYMPNGSVADRLRDSLEGKPILDWRKRLKIALGAARGLLYLHEQCNPKILHRDVKAANILLDEAYEAVVGDFGLAKLMDTRDSHVTTAVRGTVGHIAPEYLATGQSSEKTDVFGFGMLILELICGHKASNAGNMSNQKGLIIDWVKTVHEEKKWDLIIDSDLKGSLLDAAEVEQVISVAILCTQANPGNRPKMSEVVDMLGALPSTVEHLEELVVPYQSVQFAAGSSSDCCQDSSFIVQAMELSGPR